MTEKKKIKAFLCNTGSEPRSPKNGIRDKGREFQYLEAITLLLSKDAEIAKAYQEGAAEALSIYKKHLREEIGNMSAAQEKASRHGEVYILSRVLALLKEEVNDE